MGLGSTDPACLATYLDEGQRGGHQRGGHVELDVRAAYKYPELAVQYA